MQVWGSSDAVFGLKFQEFAIYSAPSLDRIWAIWGSYFRLPKAIFYLLKGDYGAIGIQVSSMSAKKMNLGGLNN